MGKLCPTCQTYQPIVQNLTTHQGRTNLKAVDVVAFRLGCGHDVGGKEYEEFQKYVRESEAQLQKETSAAKKAHNVRLSKALASVQGLKKEGAGL